MEIDTKICTKCNQSKSFDCFYKAKLGKYGLKSICRMCQADEAVIYGNKNKEKISVQRAEHTKKNKERLAEYASIYRKNNPGKINAKTAKRRAQKRKATPKWLTEVHWKQIEAFYIEAAELKEKTGIPHEVDHIIPLRGDIVKGLHVPWNLRVVTRSENRHKSRKFLII